MCQVTGDIPRLLVVEEETLIREGTGLYCHSENNDVAGLPNFNLTHEHLNEVLIYDGFITDEILNAYHHVLWYHMRDHHPEVSFFIFNTYFFPILKQDMAKAIEFHEKVLEDLILVPVHIHGNHWTLLVADLKKSEIRYYDSLGGQNAEGTRLFERYLQLRLVKEGLSQREWKIVVPSVPGQEVNDCGIFTLRFGLHELHNLCIDFGQKEMDKFRPRVVFDILQGEISF
jgi:Ulp1 family protease